jgi:hypothetical protein
MRPHYLFGNQCENFSLAVDRIETHTRFRRWSCISDLAGNVFAHHALNDSLLDVLDELFNFHSELFPPSISDKEVLQTRVQVCQTLWRTVDTRALEQKVGQSDIDFYDIDVVN